jgi:xylulokinase
MEKYILAHDLGTSGNKASLYTINGQLVKSSLFEYPTRYFNGNWAEQDPDDWWEAVKVTTRQFLESVPAGDIAAVSFSGHMMGCLCVDRDGMPLRPHILWADMRSEKQAERIEEQTGKREFYQIVGHRASASYTLTKLMWIKENEPGVYAKTCKVLNAKDYIIYKLTGVFATEYSDASGTNALNLSTLAWSDDILKAAGIDLAKFPQLLKSTDVAGKVSRDAAQATGLMEGTPVVMGGGDGCCAAVGAGCIKEGVAYNYLGSSSWISICTPKPIFDPMMRTFNWAHIVPGYVTPCGTMQCAGGSYSWLKEHICLSETEQAKTEGVSPYEIINSLAERSPIGANGIIYLPYLIGERSPWWNPDAKGAFIGLKMENNRADVCRSVLEGVTMNLNLILSVFKQSESIDEITIIGGGGKGKLWRKLMADIYGIKIKKPRHLDEATSIGAAVTAGVGIGAFKNFESVNDFIEIEDTVAPDMANHGKYTEMMKTFEACYHALAPIFPRM